MSAVFDGKAHTITVGGKSFEAYNNVDSSSNGKWPNGMFLFERVTTHGDDGVDSAYGSYGNVIFTVAGRSNMGVHSGRASKADGAGRKGPKHATMGCIRTTDAGVLALKKIAKSGLALTVKNN